MLLQAVGWCNEVCEGVSCGCVLCGCCMRTRESSASCMSIYNRSRRIRNGFSSQRRSAEFESTMPGAANSDSCEQSPTGRERLLTTGIARFPRVCRHPELRTAKALNFSGCHMSPPIGDLFVRFLGRLPPTGWDPCLSTLAQSGSGGQAAWFMWQLRHDHGMTQSLPLVVYGTVAQLDCANAVNTVHTGRVAIVKGLPVEQ